MAGLGLQCQHGWDDLPSRLHRPTKNNGMVVCMNPYVAFSAQNYFI